MKQYAIFKYKQKGWEHVVFIATTVDNKDGGVGAQSVNDDFSDGGIRIGTRIEHCEILVEPRIHLALIDFISLEERLRFYYGESATEAIRRAERI